MWIIIEAKVASANPHPAIVQQLSLNVSRNRIATAVIGMIALFQIRFA